MEYLSECCFTCIHKRHRELINKCINLLPKKVKNLVVNKRFVFLDTVDKSINYNKGVEGETAGHFNPPRFIYITPKSDEVINNKSFMGEIFHEIAHGYIYHMNFIKKFFIMSYFKFKSSKLPRECKMFHRFEPEEIFVDWIVKMWGCDEYIQEFYSTFSTSS